jgi:hypothetical protein
VGGGWETRVSSASNAPKSMSMGPWRAAANEVVEVSCLGGNNVNHHA